MKEIVASMLVPRAHVDFAIAKSCARIADYIANSLGGGGGGGVSRYVGVSPVENLPVFKLQRLECLHFVNLQN